METPEATYPQDWECEQCRKKIGVRTSPDAHGVQVKCRHCKHKNDL